MATNNSLNINSSTPLILAWGGTNSSLTASNGGILYSDASKLDILAGTATADQIILSGSSSAPAWSTATYLATMTANAIHYASSANVMGQITVVDNATLVTSATGVPSLASMGTNGYLLIGSGSGAPVPGTLTQGTGISITNGSNSITIASTSGVAWASISGTTQTAAVNTGYVVSNASQTTITLPATAALGSVVRIAGLGAGGWVLAPGAGQTINLGEDVASTSITSANANDAIEVVCVVANTTWSTISSVGAGFTYV